MKYSTDRLITVLASVNGTAIDNDGGVSGRYLEEICHAAADRLRELHLVEQKHLALDKRPKSTTQHLPGQVDLSERTDICGTPDRYGWTCCGHDPCVRRPHRDGHPSFLEMHGDRDW